MARDASGKPLAARSRASLGSSPSPPNTRRGSKAACDIPLCRTVKSGILLPLESLCLHRESVGNAATKSNSERCASRRAADNGQMLAGCFRICLVCGQTITPRERRASLLSDGERRHTEREPPPLSDGYYLRLYSDRTRRAALFYSLSISSNYREGEEQSSFNTAMRADRAERSRRVFIRTHGGLAVRRGGTGKAGAGNLCGIVSALCAPFCGRRARLRHIVRPNGRRA